MTIPAIRIDTYIAMAFVAIILLDMTAQTSLLNALLKLDSLKLGESLTTADHFISPLIQELHVFSPRIPD